MKYGLKCLGLAAVALAAAWVGCSSEDGGVAAPKLLRDTPDDCLRYVEIAFNDLNVHPLDAALSNSFEFYFNAGNVGNVVNGYTIPEKWTVLDFKRAAGNTFKHVYDVTLEIHAVGGAGGAVEFEANKVGLHILVLYDEQNGIRLDNGWCDFKFVRTDGWKLTAWYDETVTSGDEPMSFGVLLASYYNE